LCFVPVIRFGARFCEVVGVFVRFRAPLFLNDLCALAYLFCLQQISHQSSLCVGQLQYAPLGLWLWELWGDCEGCEGCGCEGL
jgi:hypothetical protein